MEHIIQGPNGKEVKLTKKPGRHQNFWNVKANWLSTPREAMNFNEAKRLAASMIRSH